MIHKDLKDLARPIDFFKLMPGNPRKGDIEAVARSYERFGQRKPIIARTDGTVIAGNHQLQAARQLGWKEIAVVFVDDDDLTAKAYALADNRTGDLGTYDLENLNEFLASVAVDEELLFASGYSQSDVDAMLSMLSPMPLDDLFDDVGPMTEDDELRRVSLNLPPELAEALSAELNRIGSHSAAVEMWLGL